MRDQNVDSKRLERELDGVQRAMEYGERRVASGHLRLSPRFHRAVKDNLWQQTRLQYSLGYPLDQVVAGFRGAFDYAIEHDVRLSDGSEEAIGPAIAVLCGFTDVTAKYVAIATGRESRVGALLIGLPEAQDITNYDVLTRKWAVRSRELIETCLHDRDHAPAELAAYVRNHWYRASRYRYWWDTHKREVGYFGYWCFLGAAIARVTGTDDSALEGHRYYPYELAHYLDT